MYWFESLDKLIKVTPKKNATLHSAFSKWFPKKVALIEGVNGRGSRWRSTNDHQFFPDMNQFSLTMIGREEQELFSQNINHPPPSCNQPWLELLLVTVLLFFSPKMSNPYPFLKNKTSTNIQYVPSNYPLSCSTFSKALNFTCIWHSQFMQFLRWTKPDGQTKCHTPIALSWHHACELEISAFCSFQWLPFSH